MARGRDTRSLLVRSALALLVVGGAVFLSPFFVRSTFAAQGDVTCTATCRGGSCTGNKPYCVCTCSLFFNVPVCNCTDNAPSTGGTAPEQQPATGT